MELDKIKLTQIEPADYNPRKISEEDKKKLRNSLETFGLVDPIIINLQTNRIIGGHQRYDVLLDMVMESDNLAEKEYDLIKKGDIGLILDIDDLKLENEDYEKALNLALNKISGDWDYDKLSNILDELSISDLDMELTGFDDLELTNLDLGDSFDDYDDDDFVDHAPTDFTDDFKAETLHWIDKNIYLVEGETWKLGTHEFKVGKPDPDDYYKLFIKFDDMTISAVKLDEETATKIDEILKDNPDNIGLSRKGDEYFEYD